MKHYFALLSDEKVLRKLSWVQLISYFGAWFSNVAIYTLLIDLGVGPEIIAFVAMLHFLSGVIQAPFSGALIDKLHPKRLMLTLLAVQIVSTFLLIFVDSVEALPLLYILIFIKMGAASFYFTSEMSLLPRILDGEKLKMANEIHSIIWSFAYTAGMAISGYFVYIMGVDAAFFVDALFFLFSFFIFATIDIETTLAVQTQNILQMMRESVLYLKREPKVWHLMLVHAFVGFTAFDALVALLAKNYYAGIIAVSLALGLLHSFRALGLVLGPVILGRWIHKRNLIRLFVFEALAIGIWGYVMHDFYLSLVASIVVGFFTTTLWSYSYTLIQKNTDEKFYGRIVAYNDMLFLSVSAFTSYMTGLLAKWGFELENIAYMLALTFLIGAIYYYAVYKKYELRE